LAAAGLAEAAMPDGGPSGIAECPIQLQAEIRDVRQIDAPDSGMRALEATVQRVPVDDALLVADRPDHFDALAWDPLIMRFTEFFAGGAPVHDSSPARGWQMPPLGVAAPV
jgi:flavin reductase (DIM6/NTAB) family NADH-FMN oxidoreductase RutF